MPVDVEVINQVFNDFEGENFVDAKSKLADQFKIAKNDYLKNKLGLSGNVVQLPVTSAVNVEKEEDIDSEEDIEVEKSPKRRLLKRK
jgi:hypothetical protein